MPTINKDNLKASERSMQSNAGSMAVPGASGPLQFWTRPPEGRKVLVDLAPFATGQEVGVHGRKLRNGPFVGRPRLMHQLFPAVKDQLAMARAPTVDGYRKAFRTWCRVIDLADKRTGAANGPANSFGVEHLGPLHLQIAVDTGVPRKQLSDFRRVVDLTRRAMSLPPLFWTLPVDEQPTRELQPAWQTQAVRVALKRGWFEALDRWQLTSRLLGAGARSADEADLLSALHVVKACADKTGLARPSADELHAEASGWGFAPGTFPVTEALRAFYPDATDIRMAFNTCMASTGWNASTFLELDAGKKFVFENPKDPSRYVMYGNKPRARSEQISEGLMKSQGSPASILLTLVNTTAPLRKQLQTELDEALVRYRTLTESGHQAAAELFNEIEHLREGVKSPWLYVAANHGIAWLYEGRFQFLEKRESFLGVVIAKLNRGLPRRRQIATMTGSDFRLAYAEYALRASGGSVLFVKRELGHRTLGSTTGYLNSTVINTWADQLYLDVSESIWMGIRDEAGIDTVVLALRSRSGSRKVTAEEHRRLEHYRKLKRSRLNIGCADPTNPPRHIAPTFVRDGIRECCIHRCLLCPQKARILPESLSGIAMRAEEIDYIKARISVEAFLASSFPEEYENAESALKLFDEEKVLAARADWRERILDGRHRVVLFDSAD